VRGRDGEKPGGKNEKHQAREETYNGRARKGREGVGEEGLLAGLEKGRPPNRIITKAKTAIPYRSEQGKRGVR